MSRFSEISDDDFIKIISKATSLAEAIRLFGYSKNCGSIRPYVIKRAKELNVSIPVYKTGKSNPKYTLEEIMVKDSFYTNINRLKIRIIRDSVIPYKCEICKIGPKWNGIKLVLQLDHINGINTDHRKENLRFLCPNCHSQTETFSGKNIK